VAVYYLETSALVKRYARELGTDWVIALTDPALRHDLYTVRLTGPELIAALARKARLGAVAAAEAARAIADFRSDWQQQYHAIGVNDRVIDRAMLLAESHGLRGYDAVHLAAALEVADAYRATGGGAVTLVSADAELLDAGLAEGLVVDNPNAHP
jgi:predicted nucleic acid-binding protein